MKEIVSIIVIADKDLDKVVRTVDNLLQQDYSDVEIIIADKESENTKEDSLQKKYGHLENIQYIIMPAECNRAVMMNLAAEAAKGIYLAFANAGTIWNTQRIDRQLKEIQYEKDFAWCYCIVEDAYKKEIFYPDPKVAIYKKQGNIFPDVILETLIDFQSVIVKKDIYVKLGGMEEALAGLEEYEFLLRLVSRFPAVYCNEVLIQAEPVLVSSVDALVSQCYILCEFAEDLKRLGIKEEKFLKVIKEAEQYHVQNKIKEYLEILKEDPDYNSYLKQFEQKKYPRRNIISAETKEISGIKNCVGCGACFNICPVNAIQMEYDQEGFLVPAINKKVCISCGKCLSVCPTQVELKGQKNPQVCYAVQAEDDIRMESSSGGIFPLLSREFLKSGGYVAGAVYDKNFHVVHIVSNKVEDIWAMQTSKYVQSDTINVFPKIKRILERGEKVLFTGCACQIAALKTFLKKEYEQLYTVDVVCHGVPSVKVYENYLKELNKKYGKIKEVNFRKKKVSGWKTELYVRDITNKEYVKKGYEPYIFGFLQNWFLRQSCYQCEFREIRYSDMTIGDFWGIQYLEEKFEDGKGTSYVTINSVKGYELYRSIKNRIKKLKDFETEKAIRFNPNIQSSVERTKIRDIFFENWNPESLESSITKVLYSQHFDIGLVLWWSSNHGNAITNYALYKLLEKDYRVLAIDSGPLYPQKRFRKFAKDNYICSSDYYPRGAISVIDKCCDTLIVGSDQTWNVYFETMLKCGKYYQLDFASENTRKISYAASFGMKSAEPQGIEYTKLYQKFDCISVREAFGVDVCRDEYGVDATLVLDPVFLLEEQDYCELIDKVKIKESEPYICAYLLNPTKEKRDACNAIRNQMGGIKIINLTEGDAGLRDDFRHILEFENIKLNVTVEEWLYYMKNSQYIVTDSFHGTCFSIIFKKNFMSFVNRQPDRFDIFERFGNASEHIGKSYTKEFLDICLETMDYGVIEDVLAKEREKSKKWLEMALKNKN